MNPHLDLADILALAGLIIAAACLYQLSPWLVGALGGLALATVGMLRAR